MSNQIIENPEWSTWTWVGGHVWDSPKMSELANYTEELEKLPEKERRRLLEGEWTEESEQ